jgi:hypothetical protein
VSIASAVKVSSFSVGTHSREDTFVANLDDKLFCFQAKSWSFCKTYWLYMMSIRCPRFYCSNLSVVTSLLLPSTRLWIYVAVCVIRSK